MKRSNLFSRPLQLIRAGLALCRMPRVRLRFPRAPATSQIYAIYKIFSQPHPRFFVIKNKTLGIALIHLRDFKTSSEYLGTVNKKDYAAYHARRARNLGYTVFRIDRNDFIDQIHAIHVST